MMVMARPQFMLAVCRNMSWVDGGIFASAREAAIAAAHGTGDTQVIQLRAFDDPQVMLASLKRALMIARRLRERKTLLVGFYFAAPHPNPLLNMHRRPAFAPTTDAGMVVKFQTAYEARACLTDAKRFAPDAFIQIMDWREPT
jgi:hypothetical protein